jgi:protease I
MGSKRILLLVGDYVEDYEAMVPLQALSLLGHTVHAVCPGKKAGEKVRTAIHDDEGAQTYVERPGHLFKLNFDFDRVRSQDYDALLVPGGRAPEYLRLNPRVLEIVREFVRQKKPVAAICHGIQVLTAADVVRGRACTSFFALEPEVRQAGGEWVSLPEDRAHADGLLVTGTTWASTGEWLSRIVPLLGTKIEP